MIAIRLSLDDINPSNHPIGIIKDLILSSLPGVEVFDDFSPIVSITSNFDSLLVPEDHVCRSPQDTYYVDSERVLRTHTSAHQVDLMSSGYTEFLVVGDVYRRDEIDRTHYPVFHQMEGVKLFEGADVREIEFDLRSTIDGILDVLFPSASRRWVESTFPFTDPSWEVEVYFNGKWLEVLGCGIIHSGVIANANFGESVSGWAFGLGLERLAMVLFSIPDIRLFWTDDSRFTSQFVSGSLGTFVPYSSYPSAVRDIAFWLGEDYSYNDFCSIVRERGGDLVEDISLIDSFVHPKTGKASHCYRISYQSMSRTLTGEEINDIQSLIVMDVENDLGVKVR